MPSVKRKYSFIIGIKRILHFFQDLLNYFKPMLSERQFLYVSCILVACSAAGAAIVLKSFAHQVFTFASYASDLLKFPYIKSIFPIIGILLTIWLVQRFLNGKIEKGTAQIMIAVAKKSGIMPKKQMYAQILTSSLTVGMGGSAGLESPITITGAAFGANYAQYYKLKYKHRTLLLACGVAAGIATAFNAPIAGVLFAIEIVLADMSVSAFIPLLLSSATGAILGNLAFKDNMLLVFKSGLDFNYQNTIYYIILGVIGGFVSLYHARVFRKVEQTIQSKFTKPYQKGLVGASLLAILIFLFPSLFGEGYASIKHLANDTSEQLVEHSLFETWNSNAWLLLLLSAVIMLTKAIATGLTLGSGGNGGNFAPALFVGSYLGFILSKTVNLLGIKDLPIENFTVVGMAALLSGLFHAPLTAIFLIAEITGSYGLFVPLMIVSSISFAISKRYDGYAMDIFSLADKGVVFTSDKDFNLLSKIPINTLVMTDIKSVKTQHSFQEIKSIFQNNNQLFIPVLNDDDTVRGVILWEQVKENLLNSTPMEYTNSSHVSATRTVSILSNSKFLLQKMEESEHDFVLLTKAGKYQGYITRAQIMHQYRENVKKLRIE